MYNPVSTWVTDNGEIPFDQEVYMWDDSDIPYLQQTTDLDMIKLSVSRGGGPFSKIGVKITETSQPYDWDPFSRS